MAEVKTETAKGSVGDRVELREDPAEVTGPDGISFTVVGGVYVLDRPGVHVVNGVTVTVK